MNESARVLSPDGRWTAVVCQDNGNYTRVSQMAGSTVWDLPVIDTGDTFPGADWYLQPYHWADDGHFLYLAPRSYAEIDCIGCTRIDAFGLYRLSLSTGRLETWFSPDINGYSFAFSPGDRYFVYADASDPHLVVIRDLSRQNPRYIKFDAKYEWAGAFAWSTDSSELVIVARINEESYSLFLYRLEDRSLKILVQDDPRPLYPPTGYDYEIRLGSPWISEDLLILGDPIFGGKAWTLNLRTGVLLPYVNPSPTSTHTP